MLLTIVDGVLGFVIQRVVEPSPPGGVLFKGRRVEVHKQPVARADQVSEREHLNVKPVSLARLDTKTIIGIGRVSVEDITRSDTT